MRKSILTFLLALLLAACQSGEPPANSDATAEQTDPSTAAPESDATATEPMSADGCFLSVGWDPWAPYHHAPVGDQVQGLDVDLITALADSVGCELEWEQHSWASMLPLIRIGDLDLLPGATRTPERSEFAWFSDPYREESFRIHVRADEVEQWTGQSLAELFENGFRLGLTRGYIYGEEVSRVLDNPEWQDQIVEVPVGELNVLNLMDFRIDGFLEDPFVAANIDHRRDWGVTFEALPLDVYSGDVHLMFSRDSVTESRVQAFNEALQALRESGRHQAILDRYDAH